MRDILSDLEQGLQLSDPDPVRRAQIQMRTPLPKRFYTAVSVEPAATGYAVLLDGRSVKTPLKAVLALPTEGAALLVAAEFEAQDKEINPVTMPVLRLANTAIDGVAREPEAVAEDILRFASSDMLFYRADGPEGLVERQNEAWDPVLDWARTGLHAKFLLAEGVMPVEQPREAVAAVRRHLAPRTDPFRLASLHLLTSLMGSALLALAVEVGAVEAEQAWAAAHVDENWNVDHWGQDSEAVARQNARHRDFEAAVKLLAALDPVAA